MLCVADTKLSHRTCSSAHRRMVTQLRNGHTYIGGTKGRTFYFFSSCIIRSIDLWLVYGLLFYWRIAPILLSRSIRIWDDRLVALQVIPERAKNSRTLARSGNGEKSSWFEETYVCSLGCFYTLTSNFDMCAIFFLHLRSSFFFKNARISDIAMAHNYI